MIATWMIYAIVVGAMAWAAAAVLARAARALGWQSRWTWVGAIVVTCVWPVIAPLRQTPTAPPVAMPNVVPTIVRTNMQVPHATDAAPSAFPAALPPAAVPAPPSYRARLAGAATEGATVIRGVGTRLNGVLVPLWALASLVLLLRLLVSIRVTRRARTAWRAGRVDGARVLLSTDVGPAVLGVGDLHIVIPSWALELDPAMRAAMLRHEEEHRRARDPQLLLGAMVVSALMPWNPAVWWQARRLRLAIETDCDQRVLGVEPDVERYGSLLLAIAERQTPRSLLLGTALLEPVSNLERRIAIMTTPAPKYPRLVAAGLGSLAALVAFALVATPAPPLFAQTTAKAVPPIAKAVPQDSAREKIVVAVPAKLPVVWTEAKPTNAAPAKKTPVAVRTPQTTARADSATQQTQKVVGTLNPVTIHAALRAAAAAPQQATVRNQDSIRAQLQRDREELARLRERIAANEALLLRARPDSTPMVPDSLERALGAYLASQVDTEVRAVPGQRAPYYPPALRGANVEGSVVLRFVVDTNGRALMETVRVISSSHLLFTSAVTTHLPYLRFIPGNLRGAPVRQIVRMPFVFTLSRR